MKKTLKAAAPSVFCLLCGNDFQPVAVRVGDKIDAHCRIFEADAVHFLVLCVCGIEIICAEGQVELVVTEVVRLVPVAQPRQLEQMRRYAIGQVYNNKAAVRCVDAAGFGQTESLLIKRKRAVQIADVEVVVCKRKLHNNILLIANLRLLYHEAVKIASGRRKDTKPVCI